MAELIPDIGSSRVQDIPAYNGGRDSTRIMMSTRAQLDQVTLPSYALGELMTGLWWVWVSSRCGFSFVSSEYVQVLG